jgi:hypothetical protein
MEASIARTHWLRRVALIAIALLLSFFCLRVLLAHADGPFFVLAGGPFRSGEIVALDALDWTTLDNRHELEMEIVGAESSRVLWFSVEAGVPYVACDLDCVGGMLERWPQQIDRDPRVVIRIDGRRADGRLVHVPHGTAEYAAVRAGRDRKYSGEGGGRAAAETAAHGAVVEWGEVLTGRAQREEPGDRLYRVDPR